MDTMTGCEGRENQPLSATAT